MNLSTATPVEIDTLLADIDRRMFIAGQTLGSCEDRVERLRTANDYYRTYHLPEAEERLAAAQATVAALNAEAAPLDAEYERRPWTRTWMVLNNNGHGHRTTNCGTCFTTTKFGWLPTLSGSTAAQVVEALGADTCIVCYPEFRDSIILNRPRVVFTAEETEERGAREVRDAEKATKAAAKAAKAIANPDGTPLRGKWGVINTEVTAKNEYVDILFTAEWYGERRGETRPTEEEALVAAYILVVLAHKQGVEPGDLVAELNAKVAAKLKRERRA